MSEQRQKIRNDPALWHDGGGECRQPSLQGLEELKASSVSESPAVGTCLTQRTAVVRTRMPGGVGGGEP